jgi:hypothetical protein
VSAQPAENPPAADSGLRIGFWQLIPPDPGWIERLRESLNNLTAEERTEMAARYIATRYGRQEDFPTGSR